MRYAIANGHLSVDRTSSVYPSRSLPDPSGPLERILIQLWLERREAAIANFEYALGLDPEHALAQARLAELGVRGAAGTTR